VLGELILKEPILYVLILFVLLSSSEVLLFSNVYVGNFRGSEGQYVPDKEMSFAHALLL
jgi:hypothetical protein